MKIRLAADNLANQQVDALLLFKLADRPLRLAPAAGAERALLRRVETWLKKAGFSGRHGEQMPCAQLAGVDRRLVVVTGLGHAADFHAGCLERAASAAWRAARRMGCVSAAAAMQTDWPSRVPATACAGALVRGVEAGDYTFTRFRSPPAGAARRKPSAFTLACAPDAVPALRPAVAENRVIGEVFREVRDLANLPGNKAGPEEIAAAIIRLARRHGLRASLMRTPQLRRAGCHALLAVGRGSHRPVCLLTLEHAGRRRGAPVALVGKTITFDSGGLSLKRSAGMEWMKFDKSGGMAVLATLAVAARLRWPQPLLGLLAVAENMPGGAATRPGDIVPSLAGKTIEIVNTDAEGRLALADALTLAARRRPRAIIDVATLTGAAIVALGRAVSAVLGSDPALVNQLIAAGEECGDRLWPLPLWPDYADDLRGEFSDLKNIGVAGEAGTIYGAAFLRQFVPDTIPWAHLDIAGTAWVEKEKAGLLPGATLAGAMALITWLKAAARP